MKTFLVILIVALLGYLGYQEYEKHTFLKENNCTLKDNGKPKDQSEIPGMVTKVYGCDFGEYKQVSKKVWW